MRIIDADKFAEDICNLSAIDEHSANAVIFLLHEQPTVDIKPEVAREIFAEIEKVADTYNEDGDFYIDNGLYRQLKNKYIGGAGE